MMEGARYHDESERRLRAHKLHAWRNLIAHLIEAGETTRLFELLEELGFLAGQADFFGDFGRTSEDVEAFVLPATIAAADWNRFLHYAAIALNLRGLAEDLAEPGILQALTQGNGRKLALDVAGRLTEPLRRAAALSVVARECRNDPSLFRQMLESIEQSLEAPLPPPRDSIESDQRIERLARMARLLGPDFTSSWSVWIGKAHLSPQGAAPIWRAVAESWLDRDEAHAPALWEALRQISDPAVLLAFLPESLAGLSSEDTEETLTKLLSLFPIGGDRLRAGLFFLSHLASSRPDHALSLAEKWLPASEIPWTSELIEAGGPLLALYTPEDREALAGRLGEPITRAALRVVVLSLSGCRPDPIQTEAALAAVEQIPDGPDKLHWALRYLEARPADSADEVRGQVAAVARYLHEIRYDAPPDDLRRYLDLVGRSFVPELEFQIDSVFTSPASHPDVLYAIVRSARSPEVVKQLLRSAARYASLAALNESQAFRLRGEILTGAARRLCLLGEDPASVIEMASERLLLQEEDEARFMLVPLAVGFPGAAAEIAQGIQDGKRKLLAQLRVRSADAKDLTPSRLYEKVAQSGALDVELSGLTALLGPPDDPELLERAPDDRVDLCLRLGWHALEYEARHFQEDWDPRAVLSRIEPRLALETDEQLVAWTPDIVALAVQPNDRQAVAEVTEAAERIAGLESISWPLRRKALESLLASLPAIFKPLGGSGASRAGRRAKAAISSLSHLPQRLHPGKARDELAEHWQDIEPMVTAAMERLAPSEPAEDESQDFQDTLRDLISSGTSPSEPGVEPMVRRVWDLSSDLTKALARRVQESLADGGRPRGEAALRWWLHAHLAPRLGKLDEPGLGRARKAATALSRAHSLGPNQRDDA